MTLNTASWAYARQQGRDEWLTPPEIISELGPFDLDPCASAIRPWPTADVHYTKSTDPLMTSALELPWHGRVWLNPPYGTQTIKWLRRLADHGNGIALIFARTETKMFFECVWGAATGILFIKGRLKFYGTDGKLGGRWNAGSPSCLIAYGDENAEKLRVCDIAGKYIRLRQ